MRPPRLALVALVALAAGACAPDAPAPVASAPAASAPIETGTVVAGAGPYGADAPSNTCVSDSECQLRQCGEGDAATCRPFARWNPKRFICSRPLPGGPCGDYIPICKDNRCRRLAVDDIQCVSSDQCAPWQACVGYTCVGDEPTSCGSTAECPDGLVCTDATCQPPAGCGSDTECEPFEACVDGVCSAIGDVCTVSSDCDPGDLCVGGFCVDGTEAFACGPTIGCPVDTYCQTLTPGVCGGTPTNPDGSCPADCFACGGPGAGCGCNTRTCVDLPEGCDSCGCLGLPPGLAFCSDVGGNLFVDIAAP